MIYLDNAATSFPKPAETILEMMDCMKYYCGNPGRSGHEFSMISADRVYNTRKKLAELIKADKPERIIFTSNATEALNMGIKSVISPGDHIITTVMEHNSVLRPLNVMREKGVQITIVGCDREGIVKTENIEKEIKENTKLIIVTHASNVTGGIMPIEEIGKVAERNKKLLMVDASQTAGTIDIDVKKMKISILAAPGHKSLLGPMGTGFLYSSENVELKPLKQGGTGTESDNLSQPEQMPEGFEAGTINVPGIIGLGKSLDIIKKIKMENIISHERELIKNLEETLGDIKQIKIYGPKDEKKKTGVLAFNIDKFHSEEIAEILNNEYGIGVRAGYQCAPLAHKFFGTERRGIVRISVGPNNTIKELKYVANAILRLVKRI